MSPNHPWFKQYAKDWIGDPELRLCSPAARGLLEDIMCLCHLGNPYGYLTRRDGTKYSEGELCKVLHYKRRQYRRLYAELLKRTRIVENGAGMYVPRLVREKQRSERFSQYGRQGGHPELLPDEEPQEPITPKPKGKKRAKKFEYEALFETFWEVYPRPIGKRAAFVKWQKAIKDGVLPVPMIAAARKYADSVAGEEMKYIKHPATWLNQGCWDDVLDKEQQKRRQDESRRKARRKEYEKTMSEHVSYIMENSAAEKFLGAESLEDLINRVGGDVEKQLGPKGLEDYNRRVKAILNNEIKKGER